MALGVVHIALRFWNPSGAIVVRVLVRDPAFPGALLDRFPDHFCRFAAAGLFPDLADDRVADDSVDAVVQVASEAVRWVTVVPFL